MSLSDQNRMLHILHRNGVNRDNITKIMKDLQESEIFDDPDVVDDDYSWELIDQKAEIWFNNNLDPAEKLDAIRNIVQSECRQENKSIQLRNKIVHEKRIQAKIKEMEAKGLIEIDDDEGEGEPDRSYTPTTQFGRTPLHHAVAMRNLRLVEKYVKRGLYIDSLDNNGHTPLEMAYYEGFKEAVMVFKTHQSEKSL